MKRARVYGRRHQRGEKNKNEEHFESNWIKPRKAIGEIVDYWFEEWTFVLADGCRYTPDFVTQDKDGYLDAYEVKGTKSTRNEQGQMIDKPFFHEDAQVKLKVAPRRFPLRFWIAYRQVKTNAGHWTTEEI